MDVADILIVIINVSTLGGVLGIVWWARRWSRCARAENRSIVREIGRLRMVERDTTELSKALIEIRRHLVERPDEYAKGFVDGMRRGPGPDEQGGGGPFPPPRLVR